MKTMKKSEINAVRKTIDNAVGLHAAERKDITVADVDAIHGAGATAAVVADDNRLWKKFAKSKPGTSFPPAQVEILDGGKIRLHYHQMG